MNHILAFFNAHSTSILLFAAWNFSAFLSAMPPLPENCGYFARWIHDYFQLLAANLNKRQTSTFSQTTSPEKTETIATSTQEKP